MDKLKFKTLSLDDKLLFDKYFNEYPSGISEYTFTNLYVWRNSREVEYAQYNEGLIILACFDNEKYFMPPIGFKDNKKIFTFLLDYGIKHNITHSIKRVHEKQIYSIQNMGLKITEDRNNFDYVYNTEDMAFLKGRKYSSKRNFVKKFCSEYYHRYTPYTNDCKKASLNLMKKWLNNKNINEKTLVSEYKAIEEFLNNFENLNAIGGVLCVGLEIVAFAFGEKLNKNTFVIHFEKGDFNYSGVYQTINKLFVENEIEGQYDFINREQDLGISGIRKAKLSYVPVKMIKKYNVSA